MRIVYLHQYFRTPAESGGVRSYHFGRALAERGHDVHVVTAGSSASGRDGRVRGDDGLPFHVHRIDVPYDNSMSPSRRLRAFASFALRSARLARRLRGDVVVATSTPLTIALPGLWAIVGRRARLVFEIRDSWPEVPIALGALKSPIARAGARWLERVAVTRAAHVVALSQGMADGAVRAGADAADVTVIPNIADVDAFGPGRGDGERWLCAHPEFAGRPLAVYCGTLGRVNGISAMVDLALEARRLGSDLVFVVVGDGAERSAVVERARRHGLLDETFVVLDPVAKSELPDVLAAARVAFSFVIDVPELEQNSANKFFDALASGTPVAINHGGWQQEALERSGAGLRLSRDAVVAARQLVDFADDAARVDSAARAARELACRDYALPVLSRRFCDVVERAAPERR